MKKTIIGAFLLFGWRLGSSVCLNPDLPNETTVDAGTPTDAGTPKNPGYRVFNLSFVETNYIVDRIGTDNSQFGDIYEAIVSRYTGQDVYITARYNVGVTTVPVIGSPQVSTVRYHTDVNSLTDDVGFVTALVYLDEAKLDFMWNRSDVCGDSTLVEETIHILPGTLLLFDSAKFIHRTNKFQAPNDRRLLQYFLCHTGRSERPIYPVYYLFPESNWLIYKLHEISRRFDYIFPEMVNVQRMITCWLSIDNILVGTSNYGTKHGEHVLNRSMQMTTYNLLGLFVLKKIELIAI